MLGAQRRGDDMIKNGMLNANATHAWRPYRIYKRMYEGGGDEPAAPQVWPLKVVQPIHETLEKARVRR